MQMMYLKFAKIVIINSIGCIFYMLFSLIVNLLHSLNVTPSLQAISVSVMGQYRNAMGVNLMCINKQKFQHEINYEYSFKTDLFL